ncbi:MAG TPA: sigma-70 family RNA polymerase sigma factor [Acidimicrobiales bacterium]|nr:sigma-70 family RNA polymerase sigma factor [Acidimicrobiales bacterium]
MRSATEPPRPQASPPVPEAGGDAAPVVRPFPPRPAPGADGPLDPTDAGSIYRWLAPAVLGYLRSQRVAEPEDLLGEVFLQVARDLPGFAGDEQALRRWVFTVAHNRMIDDVRRRSVRPIRADQEIPEVAAAEPVADPVDPELVAALSELTDDQRTVVVLRFVADLSLADVARITGRRTGAVKALQARGLERLAERLATGRPLDRG